MPEIKLDLPQQVFEKLKAVAHANRRSVEDEIVARIGAGFHTDEARVSSLIATARKFREMAAGNSISDEEFTRTKEDSRP